MPVEWVDSRPMASLQRIAPIFAVRDVLASLAYYRQLGFVAREYAGGGYRFVTRDGIEIHTSARYLTAIRGLSALRRRSGLAMPKTSLGPGARRERRYDRRRTPTGDSTRASSSIPTATSSGSAHPSENDRLRNRSPPQGKSSGFDIRAAGRCRPSLPAVDQKRGRTVTDNPRR